jgi:hypothetical protein
VAFMPVNTMSFKLLVCSTCAFPLIHAPGSAADLVTLGGFFLQMRPKSSWELCYALRAPLFQHSFLSQTIQSYSFIYRSPSVVKRAMSSTSSPAICFHAPPIQSLWSHPPTSSLFLSIMLMRKQLTSNMRY